MTRLFGYKFGAFLCFDGILALLSPSRWALFWRDVAFFFPSPVDRYCTEVIVITEKYHQESPRAMRAISLLELIWGLLLLRLASRARW